MYGKNLGVIAIGVFAVALFLLTGDQNAGKRNDVAAADEKLPANKAKQANPVNDNICFGRTQPAPGKSSEFAPEILSRVTEVHVVAGDRVKKGQLLVTLNATPAELTYKEAQLAEAKQGVLTAQATLVNAKFTFDQAHALKMKNAMSISDYMLAKTDYDRRVAEAKMADARSVSAAAALDVAKSSYSYYELRAETGGVVEEQKAKPGMRTYPGLKRLGLIVDSSELEVITCVLPKTAGGLKVGQSVEVSQNLEPPLKLKGTVRFVSNVGDVTGKVPVYIRVVNDGLRLKAYTEVGVTFLPVGK